MEQGHLPPTPYYFGCPVEVDFGKEWGWCKGTVSRLSPKTKDGALHWKIVVQSVGSAEAQAEWSVLKDDADVRPWLPAE